MEQVGGLGLMTGNGESGCDLLGDVIGLWRKGGLVWPFSLVVEERDSVEVQPLARPPTLKFL